MSLVIILIELKGKESAETSSSKRLSRVGVSTLERKLANWGVTRVKAHCFLNIAKAATKIIK